ncbi:MAG: hypothetical protein QNK23_17765 [Crocinitomicaceae bacterium]|nr:hypothetical protein [Crocinitomicaceae bacterium]
MKSIYFILFCAVLVSCGPDYGNQVIGGKLTVYYTSAEDQSIAEKIALYMKDHQLLTEEKQDVQFTSLDGAYRLNLIANDPSTAEQMTFDERKLLLDLQSELRSHLEIINFQIVLCNKKFEPIYNINQ